MADLHDIVAEYAEQKARDLGEAFVNRARGYCSRRTGELADSIQAEEPHLGFGEVTVRVFVGAEHGEWQNTGTGIYGPTGQRIEPNDPDGVLAFDWPAAGGVVFVKSVAGAPGTHFWDRTKEEFGSVVAEAA